MSHSPAWFEDDQMPQRRIWAAASSAIGFIGQNFPRRYVPAAVKSAFASASFNRDTTAAAPNPEKSGRKIPPILIMASIATTISGSIGMNTPMASPLPSPRLRREIAISIDLIAQFFVRDRASSSVFGFGFDRRLLVGRRVGVFIEHVVDDVHFAVHAPFRPRLAVAQIDHARVRFVKLNIEIAQNTYPKTRRCRSWIVRISSSYEPSRCFSMNC